MIDLLVTTYNRLPYLKLFLYGIELQNDPKEYRYIFSDAGSTDGTTEYLEEFLSTSKCTDNIFIINGSKTNPVLPLNETWQAAMPFLKNEYFCMCDDDVLVYGNNFLTKLTHKMKETGYGVLAPRSPNITINSLKSGRWATSENNIIRAGLIGSHFRMCKTDIVLKALDGTFGPTRREKWFMRKMAESKILCGFLLDLTVFDMGHWTQGYTKVIGRVSPSIETVIQWGREFLDTGWSHKYPDDKKLGIVNGMY